ncbi:hypothetical protein PAUR_b0855 [Pseudoalteromonas aurantia 208]|uniref:Uncharacterized protein n=2 Tax=Pseudoalteromonas TaxID=53246 RepID=A0ABR9EK08_9GAMM|nr:hypothetical protein [Pseudoalteromonas aurantia 208]
MNYTICKNFINLKWIDNNIADYYLNKQFMEYGTPLRLWWFDSIKDRVAKADQIHHTCPISYKIIKSIKKPDIPKIFQCNTLQIWASSIITIPSSKKEMSEITLYKDSDHVNFINGSHYSVFIAITDIIININVKKKPHPVLDDEYNNEFLEVFLAAGDAVFMDPEVLRGTKENNTGSHQILLNVFIRKENSSLNNEPDYGLTKEISNFQKSPII